MKISYKRILLKLSGETVMGDQPFGVSQEACQKLALSIKSIKEAGFEVAIVIGGGNIFRGLRLKGLGMERTPADHMGMLATLINGIALQQALEKAGCSAKLMTALECPRVAETYNWMRAQEYLSQGQVLVFVGGTGNPYFTTDTAAALRASEIHADILLKATKVNGVFDKDPLKHSDARKYDTISYMQFFAQKLEVMDATAIALCMNSNIPVLVFNMQALGEENIHTILSHQAQGTLIKSD